MIHAGETSPFSRLVAPTVLRAGPDHVAGPVLAPELRASGRPRANTEGQFVVHWGQGFETNLAARRAFESALDTWAGELSSTVAIVVDVAMGPMEPGDLATARPLRAWRGVPGVDRDTWVVDALADALAGRDLRAELCPGEPDIGVVFSNSPDAWFFDTATTTERWSPSSW